MCDSNDDAERQRIAGLPSGADEVRSHQSFSMPGLQGEEILEQLIVQAPDVKVIMTTGFTNEEESLSTARAIVYKPFALDDLVRQVRAVLDS